MQTSNSSSTNIERCLVWVAEGKYTGILVAADRVMCPRDVCVTWEDVSDVLIETISLDPSDIVAVPADATSCLISNHSLRVSILGISTEFAAAAYVEPLPSSCWKQRQISLEAGKLQFVEGNVDKGTVCECKVMIDACDERFVYFHSESGHGCQPGALLSDQEGPVGVVTGTTAEDGSIVAVRLSAIMQKLKARQQLDNVFNGKRTSLLPSNAKCEVLQRRAKVTPPLAQIMIIILTALIALFAAGCIKVYG